MKFYMTETEAKQNQRGTEVIVPVNGVFTLLSEEVFQTWQNQKNPCLGCEDRCVGCHGGHCPHGYLEWASAQKARRIDRCKKYGPAKSYTGQVMAEKADWRAKHKPNRFRCMSY